MYFSTFYRVHPIFISGGGFWLKVSTNVFVSMVWFDFLIVILLTS